MIEDEGAGPVYTGKVKLRFPVARIKKIVQADEEVGKVAQVTPVVISKALELFMQSIIATAYQECQSRGARKVSVGHLKAAVMKTERFDFLQATVERCTDLAPDPVESSAGGGGGDVRHRRRLSGGSNSGSGSGPIATPAHDMSGALSRPTATQSGPTKRRRIKKEEVKAADERQKLGQHDAAVPSEPLPVRQSQWDTSRAVAGRPLDRAGPYEPQASHTPRTPGLPFDPTRDETTLPISMPPREEPTKLRSLPQVASDELTQPVALPVLPTHLSEQGLKYSLPLGLYGSEQIDEDYDER